MSKELKLDDVQTMGRLAIGKVYFIYQREKPSFGFLKYLSLFSPQEKKTSQNFLFAVKYLGDEKFEKVDYD